MSNPTIKEFLDNIEIVLINDEDFMRLLKYKPKGRDAGTNTIHPDPLDYDALANVVDEDSEEYWKLVEERFRRGIKRTDIENDAIVLVYMYAGRERPLFRNHFFSKQEVKFRVFAHEVFEKDSRIERIISAIKKALIRESEIAGLGTIELVGVNEYEAPLGYRTSELVLSLLINTKGVI